MLCQASKGSRARRGNTGLSPFGAVHTAPFPAKGSALALLAGHPPLRPPAAALCHACGMVAAIKPPPSRVELGPGCAGELLVLVAT